MSYDLDDIIEHYGVKGMKWGVRKDPDRVSAKKQAKMEKKADKKWTKGMTNAKIQKAMADSDSRTKKQQEKLANLMTNSDLYKKALSGDQQAMKEFNFKWTMEYANILNKDMSKQAELKSPSGKKALEVMLARIGDEPFMAPRIVDKESEDVSMSYDLDDIIEHYGVKGMKWGVRKEYEPVDRQKPSAKLIKSSNKVLEAVRAGTYAGLAKINPRETTYAIKKLLIKHKTSDSTITSMLNQKSRETGVVTTDEDLMKVLDRDGIKKHQEAVYDNLDETDIGRLKKYTDSAAYSRTINTYLATGQPEHVKQKSDELKESISKNSLNDMVVYRSTNLKFSTDGLAKKLDSMGEEQLAKAFGDFDKNFKGKSFKENRVYSTSTSPTFAIDTWRKVNPNAAKTYNSYLVIETKNTPGLLADGRNGKGKKLVNTGSNQEAILAPNKMTYKKLAFDEERQMFAVYMEAE